MVFSSNIFIFCYLPIVLTIYYLIKEKYKNIFLLLASIFFYFWGEGKNVFIILLSILINYSMGLILNCVQNKVRRKLVLALSVILNLGLLFYYKYFNFFVDSLNEIAGTDIVVETIILPIGISFFTFQGLSYVIDLYWNRVSVQKNPLKIALYISLFPQLIAGPIVRYKDVAAQIDKRKESIWAFSEGIYRFTTGLGKKIIFANGVGIIADEIFNAPYSEHSVITVWLGIICYTLQIYFDFSGYSDMAIGLGRMFGFEFLENFNLPYISMSIKEFWRRWHISLSSFFRDYVYIPLGGSRQGNVYFNLFVVFMLTGLWHGASWNFVVWGIWHGIFIVAERINSNYHFIKVKMPGIIKYVYTMLVVMIGWVIFRADTLEYAVGYIRRMFGADTVSTIFFQTGYYLNPYRIFIIAISVIISMGGFCKLNKTIMKCKYYIPIRNIFTIVALLICIVYVMNATYNPFIYFRF